MFLINDRIPIRFLGCRLFPCTVPIVAEIFQEESKAARCDRAAILIRN